MIIGSHMDSFLKLTPLQNAPDTRKLRQTFDKIEAHVRGLQALDVPVETYGSFIGSRTDVQNFPTIFAF